MQEPHNEVENSQRLDRELGGVSRFEVGWAIGSVAFFLIGTIFGWVLLPTALVFLLVIAVLLSRLVSAKKKFGLDSRVMFGRYREEIERSQQHWELVKRETSETIAAFSFMKDGVVVLSNDLKIELINPAARGLLSLDPDQKLVGRSFAEVIRLPKMTFRVQTALDSDKAQDFVVDVQNELVVRPVDVRIDRIVHHSSGGLVIGLRDVTEAQRVEAMRREFIANISHELKTPLAAIKGYAETVEDAMQDDPDAAFHFMGQIRMQCVRLETLVADMMRLARAQSGKKNFVFGAVSVEECIQEALLTNQPIADQKGIELQIPNPGEHRDEIAFADFDATVTIVNNLISNAVRYTPSGGTVVIELKRIDGFVKLIVRDNGVGISPSDQERIFERFYRVEKSRETIDGGTGIGLALVKNLVVTMAGEVRVASTSGNGAAFEVLLPLFDEALAMKDADLP
ncbi:MAG: PAS domain-containing sensor histidine kinase [Rhodopirellula sp.]|nr:PAS domain-containing sensor histidine kinase [Rhodopirellula sp.]